MRQRNIIFRALLYKPRKKFEFILAYNSKKMVFIRRDKKAAVDQTLAGHAALPAALKLPLPRKRQSPRQSIAVF